MKKNKNIKRKIAYTLTALALCLGLAFYSIALWVNANFTVNIQEILFTLSNPMEGGNTDVVGDGMMACLPIIILLWAGVIWCTVKEYKRQKLLVWQGVLLKKPVHICVSKYFRVVAAFLSVIVFLSALNKVDSVLGVSKYYDLQNQTTKIYEQKYVKPDIERITAEKPKNLIYIYMESMENTYQSKQDGGIQSVNYMPNLTALAKDNISFSDDEKIGGFRSIDGTTWTTAALFATSSGVPFSFPASEHNITNKKSFAPGLITIGDVLEKKGYNQAFLCGPPAEFGGIKKLLSEHGNYRFFDLHTAQKAGYLPSADYDNGFWGFEDKYLYQIAKTEILNLYREGKPFNFTMMTVDTHFKDGYVCDLCENAYETKTANVVACADKQVAAFIDWCKTQPFYADTVIVITGDHPRMDKSLVSGESNFLERTVYNCFINVQNKEKISVKNRDFTAMDMFPTILSAMGFEIPGARLGFGTNLFSDKPTLAEEMGIDKFEQELNKHSVYCKENILRKSK